MHENATKHFVDFGLLHSYWAAESQRRRAEEQEKTVRTFLLEHSDMVRFTAQPITHFPVLNWKKLSLVERRGDLNDPKFLEALDNLKSDFIEKIVNNERYHIEQGENTYEHYLYHLTPKLKNIFNTHTLLWYPREDTPFYTFEDPSFYQEGGLLGHVISHESQAYLHLTSEEKFVLQKQGVDFDPTMEDMEGEREESRKDRK